MSENIRFKYVFPDDYNPVYVNGAYGGVGPRGEIIMNFYLERSPVPREEFRTVNEDGTISEQIKIEPEDLSRTIVRYVSSGVIMSPETARLIHTWLGEHLKRIGEGGKA
ncbi:conserved hypothetical protein [uncultured spirochete]|jgi:hypothetical protein|uniref:Uncharacterized protein n=1 Tax=uncultured spirochete TaxID=156406 RepID=A0A3P3XRP1_9SPIR|nr:conserved hypothetical protein [uncultured spirochete]